MKNNKIKVLQIFNRYLEYGGEEGSVFRIMGSLRKIVDVKTYEFETSEILTTNLGKWKMPFLMQKNRAVLLDLRALQEKENFDVWQIHNVFPGLSVAVYELAAELQVPVIQYLHNYRFGCAKATYFRDGEACMKCRPNAFMPAVLHRCWRNSLPATLSMVAAIKRFWSAGGIDNIKGFIALSDSQKKAHVDMGFPEERIHVLQHYLDCGEAKECIPPASGDVLFIGRLTEEKGVELLLRSWARVDAKGRKLRIVGKGDMLEKLKQLVLDNNIADVIFEGFVAKERHHRLWSRASFFVAPSIWNEPFGMVILEAWQRSRPILATQLGSFPELITDGVDGWLAAANVEDFSAAMQRALDSADKYEEMAKQGFSKLKNNFREDKWLDKWLDILGKI